MKGKSVLEVRMRLHPAQDLLAGIAAMQAFKDQYQGRSNRGASRGSTTITANWLAGVWAEDDFCEGDGGQTFRANGGWGTWGINGRWSLMGDQLTIVETLRVADTESGEPEPIFPPARTVGRVTNAAAGSFDFVQGRAATHMVRCR